MDKTKLEIEIRIRTENTVPFKESHFGGYLLVDTLKIERDLDVLVEEVYTNLTHDIKIKMKESIKKQLILNYNLKLEDKITIIK